MKLSALYLENEVSILDQILAGFDLWGRFHRVDRSSYPKCIDIPRTVSCVWRSRNIDHGNSDRLRVPRGSFGGDLEMRSCAMPMKPIDQHCTIAGNDHLV